jgi:hypothetical protein
MQRVNGAILGWSAELLRLVLLGAVGWYMISPLWLNRWFGGGDFSWYLSALQDFVWQARAGTFPALVGQTEFHYNGFPYVRTILLFYSGALVDVLTGQRLAIFTILNIVVAASMLAATLLMYVTLVQIRPDARWLALVIAILFASAPGLLAPIYLMDMVVTVLIAPFVPVLLYGLVRFIRAADWWSCVLIDASVVLMLSTHPLVASWAAWFAAFVMGLAVLLRHRRWAVILRLVGAGVLFALLSAGLVLPIYDIGWEGSESYVFAQGYAEAILYRQHVLDWIMGIMVTNAPGQLLPLQDPPDVYNSNQLGYALWALLGLATAVAFTRRGTLELRIVIAVTAYIAALSFPLPYLTVALYRMLPKIFELSGPPEQRLYILFAAFAAVAGYLGVLALPLPRRPITTVVICALFATMCLWSVREAGKIVRYPERKISTVEDTALLERPENAVIIPTSIDFVPRYTGPVGYSSTYREVYDARLDNALLDRDQRQVESNLAAAERAVQARPSVPLRYVPAGSVDPSAPSWKLDAATEAQPGRQVQFEIGADGRYLFTYRLTSEHMAGSVVIDGPAVRLRVTNIQRPPGVTDRYFVLWTSGRDPTTLTFRTLMSCEPGQDACSGTIDRFHVQRYTDADLPIQVSSIFPYRATVAAQGGYLETHRMFLPGYRVEVNGTPVEPLRSARGRVLIPLVAGENVVALDYVGVGRSSISRWVSTIAWALLALVSAIWVVRRGVRSGRQAAA